jgi:molybdopterin-synthase adenylyltransferase
MKEDKFARYQRQMIFSGWGEQGQERLSQAAVVQVGCGALGSTLAQCLVRAGVGRYTIIDKDVSEVSNLHRQFLFDERDAAGHRNKALIAAQKLRRADANVTIKAHAVALDATNADRLLRGHDLVLDALDNIETRYLINDWCVQNHVPWIYGGVAGSCGMTLAVIPGQGPCLRCLFPDPRACDGAPSPATHGVISTIPATVAALQATEAFKILIGSDAVIRDFRVIDLWSGNFQAFAIRRNPDCVCCGQHQFQFLGGKIK